MTLRFAAFLLAALPLPVLAQEAAPTAPERTCTLAVICIEANECQPWGLEIALRAGADGGWQIDWEDGLTTEYTLAADLDAPEEAVEPTRLRSLLFSDPDRQTVQLVSFDAAAGNIVVTMHQPHIRPRSVTGFGLCTDDAGAATEGTGTEEGDGE